MRLSPLFSNFLKEIILALSFVIAVPGLENRLHSIDNLSWQFGYVMRMALIWCTLIAAGYVRPTFLRLVLALIFSVSAFFMTAFEHSTTQFLTYDAFITLVNSAGSVGDAVEQNRHALFTAAGPSLLLFAGIALAPKRRVPTPAWIVPAIPLMGVASLTLLLFMRGGAGGQDQPPAFVPLAYYALASFEAVAGDLGERQPVQLPHVSAPRSRKIVLIIDESIAGDYLDINSPEGIPTPLTSNWPSVAIHNYGLAASITNCSAGSNQTLRFGGTRGDYRRINATQPSVWAYAKKAGLRTVYIDAQHTEGTLQNFMTDAERGEIDNFVQFDGVPILHRDAAAGYALVLELADPRPSFVLVNKRGAHFPIQDMYPDAYHRYQPALQRSDPDQSYYKGLQRGFSGTPPEWRLYRNSYRNTLSWNVGAFFETLLSKADLSETTIIYTSDHGQTLHEDGSRGLYTHCGPDPTRSEGVVPLMVIEGEEASRLNWKNHSASNHNRTSHFMIFPTLLGLMGYHRPLVETHYGQALDQPSKDPGTFNTRYNARLNQKPIWLPIR